MYLQIYVRDVQSSVGGAHGRTPLCVCECEEEGSKHGMDSVDRVDTVDKNSAKM